MPEHRSMRFTIEGCPRTKKNSRRVFRNRSTGDMILAQSAAHDAWLTTAVLQLQTQRQKYRGRTFYQGQKFNLNAQIFREKDHGDVGNFIAAICDALQEAGVVSNDVVIRAFDGSRMRIDRKCPRVELELTPMTDPEDE